MKDKADGDQGDRVRSRSIEVFAEQQSKTCSEDSGAARGCKIDSFDLPTNGLLSSVS